MNHIKDKALTNLFNELVTTAFERDLHPTELFRFCALNFLYHICKSLGYSFEECEKVCIHMNVFTELWLTAMLAKISSMEKERE